MRDTVRNIKIQISLYTSIKKVYNFCRRCEVVLNNFWTMENIYLKFNLERSSFQRAFVVAF